MFKRILTAGMCVLVMSTLQGLASDWGSTAFPTANGNTRTQDKQFAVQVRQTATSIVSPGPFNVEVKNNSGSVTWFAGNYSVTSNGSWNGPDNPQAGQYMGLTTQTSGQTTNLFGAGPVDGTIGNVKVTIRKGGVGAGGEILKDVTIPLTFMASGTPGYHGALILQVSFSYEAPPRMSRWKGQIAANCTTPHHLTLIVDGVTIQDLTTSAFATYNSPSTVTIDASLDESNPNGTVGKVWAFKVDDVTIYSGVIGWTGEATVKEYFMTPQTFDCAPVTGTANFSGSIVVAANSQSAHTLTLTVAGSVVQTRTSAAGQPTAQTLSISTSIPGLEQNTIYEYRIDGGVGSGGLQIAPFVAQ